MKICLSLIWSLSIKPKNYFKNLIFLIVAEIMVAKVWILTIDR